MYSAQSSNTQQYQSNTNYYSKRNTPAAQQRDYPAYGAYSKTGNRSYPRQNEESRYYGERNQHYY